MYSWVAFPLLRITLVFTLGIAMAIHFPIVSKDSSILVLGVAFGVFLLFSLFLRAKRFFSLNLLFGFQCHLLVFLAGYCSLLFHNEKTHDDHLLYSEKIEAYQGTIIGEPEEKTNSHRYLIKLISAKDSSSWRTASGKLFLYIRKDTYAKSYQYGDRIVIASNPAPIPSTKNNGEFDYKRYLSYQQIHHQDFVRDNEVGLVSNYEGFSIMNLAIKAGQYLKSTISKHISTQRERAIALAMVLGTKRELTPEISGAYSSAGAMHVLAVSGLHVGIIYLIMSWFFKWGKNHKYGKWLILIISLAVLWTYAMITGLSPSVLRAVTMFSFLLVAEVVSREYNIYNTLSAAGMVLLCFDPYLIMSVGFQLSFLAVFGIAYMTPRLEKLLFVENKIFEKIWKITCVSIAAQIATFPITIFYFHQFPTYSLFTNLLAIPGAGFILSGSIILFFFSWIPHLNTMIAFLLNGLIFFFNEFVFWIEKLPHSTISDIYIDANQVWTIIVLIILFFIWRYTRQFSFFILASLSIIFLIFTHYQRVWNNFVNTEITFYHIENHTAIDIFDKGKMYSHLDSLLQKDTKKIEFHIKPNRLIHGITKPTDDLNCSFIDGKNKIIVFKRLKIGIIQDLQHVGNTQFDVAILTGLSYLENKQLEKLSKNATHLFIEGNQRPWIRNKINELKDQLSKNCQVITDRSLTISL